MMSKPLSAALSISLLALAPSPAPHFASIVAQAPNAELHLQVADTNAKREYGLMFRTSLPEHTGMVFVFAGDAPQTFWMKNTLIPLDMVFVAGNGVVRNVADHVPASKLTTPDDAVARRSASAKFVVELSAGEAAEDGIVTGSSISGFSSLQAAE